MMVQKTRGGDRLAQLLQTALKGLHMCYGAAALPSSVTVTSNGHLAWLTLAPSKSNSVIYVHENVFSLNHATCTSTQMCLFASLTLC